MRRTHSTCNLCSLATRPKVWSEHPLTAKLMLLGEAPGAEEETLRKPFVGASGRLLNWAISQTGLFRPSLWISNVICCRPPDNNIDSIEGRDAITTCKPGLLEELEFAAQSGVTTILALGATATHALGVSGSLKDLRGSVFPMTLYSGKKLLIVPTFHPAAIMRQHWKRSGGGTADDGVLWLADFRKAKDLAENGFKPYREKFTTFPTLTNALAFIDHSLKSNALIAVDTETTGLSYDHAKIVVIGLASSPEDAISIPLLSKHGVPYWTPEEWTVLKPALDRLFSTCAQVYQNCFFDVPLLRKAGFALPFNRVVHDTLLIHHTLTPELRHDLGTITSLYGKTPFWKSEFRDRAVTILEMEEETLRRYNLRDCVVLHQVLPPMLDELHVLGLSDFYRDEVQPLIAPLLEMTETGINFNPAAMTKFARELEGKISTLRGSLMQAMALPESFNLDSDDHLRWFLYGHAPTAFKHLEELPKKRAGTKIHAELTALQEVKDKAACRLTIPGWNPPLTDTKKPSVDKEGLLAFRIQLNNRLATIKDAEEQARIGTLLEWLSQLTEYGRLQKLMSTYTKYKPGLDGRIRPRWIATGTVSGRIACREPNLQNVPKMRDNPDDVAAQVRNFFVAAPGKVFVSCDYVNLEAQLLAYETMDPILCSVFEQGLNLHDLNTKSMFKIDETNPRWKVARRAAKIFFFGGISYGGGDQTIYQKVFLEAPELNLTFAEFKKAKDSWMADHPAYVQWKAKITEEVTIQRTIRTGFGRLRQFLSNDKEIVKEALDFKIQSAGASLVNRSMARIYHRVHEEGLHAKFVLQIHDQLVMECPLTEEDRVREVMREEMEKPFMFKGIERRIPVDPSVGTSFGQL